MLAGSELDRETGFGHFVGVHRFQCKSLNAFPPDVS